MSIRDAKGKQENRIPIRNVLISVFDKTGLDELVNGLRVVNPDVRFMSTGGTFKKVKELLGDDVDEHLIEVSEYTGFPEMEGGLVKTLHPKIHAGILGERNNPEHQRFLQEDLANGVYIDMVVVNLYPFDKVVASDGVTFEKARGNIDIGGPTMLRAAAKNFLSCAAVCDPQDYHSLVAHMMVKGGCTTFDRRLDLAQKVFDMTTEYDKAIAKYIAEQRHVDPNGIKAGYEFAEVGK